jgi:hypothetical protein
VWLLLCPSDDHPALWAAGRLGARGLAPLVVLTPELLHHSFAWEHRLGTDREPSVAFTLADGRRIQGDAVRGVLNRIAGLPLHLVEALPPADRAYALQEWTALHASWLTGLQAPVLNLPGLPGLCGRPRSHAEWIWLAAQAGLPAAPLHRSASSSSAELQLRDPRAPLRTVCVVNGVAVDDSLPLNLRDSCGRLGTLAAARLIGVTLDGATGHFTGASLVPDLRAGGEPAIDALYAALTNVG